MRESYPDIARSVVSGNARLRSVIPEPMAGFAALGKATYRNGALSAKTKELIALAIGVAARCDGCLAWHAKMAAEHGATREEIGETLAVAIQMGGGPAVIYSGLALEAYDQFVAERTAAE